MIHKCKQIWLIAGFFLHIVFLARAEDITGRKVRYEMFSSGMVSERIETSLPSVPLRINEVNDHLVLKHFYQNLPGYSEQAYWNVTSANALFNFDYLRLGLSIDQGDYNSLGDSFWSTDLSHRIGIHLDQSYTTDDSLYFQLMFASDSCFARCGFNIGYSWHAGASTDVCIDVHGLEFYGDRLYFSVAVAFVKTYVGHQFVVKPYYSVTSKGKLNLSVADKVLIGRRNNYLLPQFSTGYFPDTNSFIDYDHITDRRFRFSCDGLFSISNRGLCLVPSMGFEFSKGEKIYTSWYMQLGVQFCI